MRILLTGATGFLGSHIAEAAAQAGLSVRCLVRPMAELAHLRSLPVELATGDLADMASLLAAADGCQVLIHAAALRGSRLSGREFYDQAVQSTRRLLDAAVASGVRRMVCVSTAELHHSARNAAMAAEETPALRAAAAVPRWARAARARLLAEDLALEYHRQGCLEVAVVRPGWVYGPRDRAGLWPLLAALRAGRARSIGDGSNVLSLTYAANVAEAILAAARHERALGQVLLVANDHDLTQRRFLNSLADLLGAPRPPTLSFAAARASAWLAEKRHHALARPGEVFPTRLAVHRLAFSGSLSSAKMRRLGWTPRVDYAAALAEIQAWLAASQPSIPAAQPLLAPHQKHQPRKKSLAPST